MEVFQDQDAVLKSEEFDEEDAETRAERNAEEGAHLLGKAVKRSSLKSSGTVVRPAGFGHNKANKRPYKDGAFSIAFVALTTATVCVGIFAVFNHNPDYFRIRFAKHDSASKGCTFQTGSHNAPSFSLSKATFVYKIYMEFLRTMKTAPYVLQATLILSAPLASGLLWITRKHTTKMFLALPFMFATVLATLVLVRVWCVLQGGCQPLGKHAGYYLPIGVCCSAFISLMRSSWDNIQLGIRVIETASEVLYKNLGLLLVLAALRIAFLFYNLQSLFAVLMAYANGNIVLNPKMAPYQELNPGSNLETICKHFGEPCCVWETDSWAPAYLILAILANLWGWFVLTKVEEFTVSRTISQWYFGAAPNSTTIGRVNTSLRHALGPSFGTVCFASLAPSRKINFRRAAGSSGKKSRVARIREMIRGCVVSILPGLEFLTAFTTTFAAIMGESFCRSATTACDLLKRNFLPLAVANWIPRQSLQFFALLPSALYGILVWGVVGLFFENGEHRSDSRPEIAFVACFVLWIVLVCCIRILDHVVNSLYICYAIDVDNGEVSKPLVHDVYSLLPSSRDCCIVPSVPDSKVAPKRSAIVVISGFFSSYITERISQFF